MLSESDTNLRQPIELENQLLKHMTMDSEVGQSMLQLLQVRKISHLAKHCLELILENLPLDTLAELVQCILCQCHGCSELPSHVLPALRLSQL